MPPREGQRMSSINDNRAEAWMQRRGVGPFGGNGEQGSAAEARGRQALRSETGAEAAGWAQGPGVFSVVAQLWGRCTEPRILASQAFPGILNSCGTGLRH